MTLQTLLSNTGIDGLIGIAAIALTIVQITPVKIDPWSMLAKAVGRALNVELMDAIRENEANNARYRIIRFDDEIRHQTRHTEEHFNQILDDIDKYEKYCKSHADYKNNKAVMAISNIENTYEKCRKERSFLP